MGDTGLMVLGGPPHLGAEAVGHPELGPGIAEELRDHLLAARRADDEAGAVAVVEHPGPEGPLADTRAGLVGFQRRAGQQPRLDQVALGPEGGGGLRQDVGERALADRQPEQVAQQACQALERDRLAEPQVQH
ncbi:MAG: hypothetical protein RLO23_02745, partial [Alphaproteobacteria bacterium]